MVVIVEDYPVLQLPTEFRVDLMEQVAEPIFQYIVQ
jgi:hypothetical protein